MDHRGASALAITLHRLSGSHARRTLELSTARERVAQHESELEGAWHAAHKLAKEVVDLEPALSEGDEAIIETAEVISLVQGSPSTSRIRSRHMSFAL